MTARRPTTFSDHLLGTIRSRLENGLQVRRSLPDWGRLAIDRPLPFLCVYRRPSGNDDRGAARLVTSEASYLLCTRRRSQREGIARLVRAVAEVMGGQFGAFLILEVWSGPAPRPDAAAGEPPVAPAFRVLAPGGERNAHLTGSLEEALRRIRCGRTRPSVRIVEGGRRWPRGLGPVLPHDQAERLDAVIYGLEVAPSFRDPVTGEIYPRLLHQLRRRLSVALRRFFFDFARTRTTANPAHFHVMGRRSLVKAVWEVDRQLADTAEAYEFLLQLTPVNGEQAWHQFKRRRYQRAPALHYRPLMVDPAILKRRLFQAPVERIEDPALALVFRQKLDELDRQITMLQDRNTHRFLPGSLQLFGGIEDGLLAAATTLLERIPPRSREKRAAETVDAETFAARARDEIAALTAGHPEIAPEVEVRSDVTGLLVSRGRLLVSSHTRIPISRVDALLQHEVGTHVLTYHNGRAQKLRHLAIGLAGYDSLQEGLAVLAEYLAGGLSRPRLRLLAGRVVAAESLVEGATFVDTFRELQRTHGFPSRTAFTITVRTHRSGGLTKDAVYLRGLQQILDHVGSGGEIEPLLVGKIAADHIPIVRELMWRGVLVKPPLLPRYLARPDAIERLARLRGEIRMTDLLKETVR